MQRLPTADQAQRLGNQITRDAAALLHELAAVVEGKARPQPAHATPIVCEHTDDIVGRIKERGDFEVRIAKANRARQRQRQRINGRDAGRTHGGRPDELGVVADHGQVVQRVDVDDLPWNLERVGERQAHIAERNRHRVAIGDDQAALGIDDQAGTVVAALRDARERRVGHIEGYPDQRWRQAVLNRIRIAWELRRAIAALHFGRRGR